MRSAINHSGSTLRLAVVVALAIGSALADDGSRASEPSSDQGDERENPSCQGEWRGTHYNAGYADFLIEHGLSRKEAEEAAAHARNDAKVFVENGHPGLANGHYDWDFSQDIVIGNDGQPPNCFGDVCKGGRQRWNPTDTDLATWLTDLGFEPSSCTCERDREKVSVYTLKLRYSLDGRDVLTINHPIHIAKQLEDCCWLSRMGDLGIMIHESPDQLWTHPESADLLGQGFCDENDVEFVGATVERVCYSRTRTP